MNSPWSRRAGRSPGCQPGVLSRRTARSQVHYVSAARAARLHRAVEVLREQVEVLDFTARTALVYGSLRADLESSGMPMSPLDTLIAATALEHRQDDADIVLVTNDHAFSRIPGLVVEDWTVEACGEGQ